MTIPNGARCLQIRALQRTAAMLGVFPTARDR
jgi:hypothetical protein